MGATRVYSDCVTEKRNAWAKEWDLSPIHSSCLFWRNQTLVFRVDYVPLLFWGHRNVKFSLSCIWRQDQDVLCVCVTQALALLTECFYLFFFY